MLLPSMKSARANWNKSIFESSRTFFFATLAMLVLAVSTFAADGDQPALRGPVSPAVPDTTSGDSAAVRGNTTNSTDASNPVILKNAIERNVLAKPFTLLAAVEYAEENYPSILKSKALTTAAKIGVTVQKLNEYLPDSLYQFQDMIASHNKITQVFFGSPVFPAVAGPGLPNNVTMDPVFYSGQGTSIDWAPIDFGLHKARINLTKSEYGQVQAQMEVTRFDVSIAVSNAFLDAVEGEEQVKASEENVASFSQFRTVVDAQVRANLKPGADASLAEAQLANATNQLLRARLTRELALAALANSIGAGGKDVSIDATGLSSEAQPVYSQKKTPQFENVPILKSSQAAIVSAMAQKKVLEKEYYPVFHFLGGFSLRGGGKSLEAKSNQSLGGDGIIPVVPNYQVALVVNWNYLDYFRIREEKKVQDQHILAQRQDYNLILQNLQTEDVRSRARVKTAVQIAANMPVQVHAAEVAVQQAEARYKTGLGSVAQVAEANQVLAQSRLQEAVARVGVWRALLAVASAHGDMKPFLAEAQRIQTKGI